MCRVIFGGARTWMVSLRIWDVEGMVTTVVWRVDLVIRVVECMMRVRRYCASNESVCVVGEVTGFGVRKTGE